MKYEDTEAARSWSEHSRWGDRIRAWQAKRAREIARAAAKKK